MSKGFRKGKEEELKTKLRESLTDEELQRIEQARAFEECKKGTFSYDLALNQDMVRRQIRELKDNINLMLWNIENIINVKSRCLDQIHSGEIIEPLDDKRIMNENELKTYMKKCERDALREVRGIATALAKLRTFVGLHDIAKNVLLTMEQYDSFVETVKEELSENGYEIFD